MDCLELSDRASIVKRLTQEVYSTTVSVSFLTTRHHEKEQGIHGSGLVLGLRGSPNSVKQCHVTNAWSDRVHTNTLLRATLDRNKDNIRSSL